MPTNESKTNTGVHIWEISPPENKRTPWIIIGLLALVSIAIGIYLVIAEKNYFGAVLFMLIPSVILTTLLKKPRPITGKIDDEGIHVDNARYNYESVGYFSLMADTLVIQLKDAEAVHIPIHEDEGEMIRAHLAQHVEEKEHEESLTNIANRYLGIR